MKTLSLQIDTYDFAPQPLTTLLMVRSNETGQVSLLDVAQEQWFPVPKVWHKALCAWMEFVGMDGVNRLFEDEKRYREEWQEHADVAILTQIDGDELIFYWRGECGALSAVGAANGVLSDLYYALLAAVGRYEWMPLPDIYVARITRARS